MDKLFFCILTWTYFSTASCSTPFIQNIADGISKNLIGLATKGGKTDIVILLDMAGPRSSCHRRMHEYMKLFGTGLICSLPTANGIAKVAVVSYASRTHVRYNFRMHQSTTRIKNAIKRIRYTGGRRATGSALDRAIELQFNRKYGGRSDATKIVLVLTSGRNNLGPSASQSALCLKRKGAHIFVLGTGPYASWTEMKKLGSRPLKNHVWMVKNPKYLRSIIKKMVCPRSPPRTTQTPKTTIMPTTPTQTPKTTIKPTTPTQKTTAEPTKLNPTTANLTTTVVPCKVNYKKVGCFSDPQGKHRPFPHILENSKDISSSAFHNHLIDWKDYKNSLETLINHCVKRAKAKGYKYIAIQYYGECWSGPQPKETMKMSTNCVNTKFKPCDPVQDCACTGKQQTNFVYKLE